MKCLDTDFLIALLRGVPEAKNKLLELDSEGRHSTTAINAFELFYGAYKSRERKNNLQKVMNLLERLDVIPFELESSEIAGETSAFLSSRGESIDFRDAMIAAVAKSKGLTLVSRNRDHFSRFKDLKLEAW